MFKERKKKKKWTLYSNQCRQGLGGISIENFEAARNQPNERETNGNDLRRTPKRKSFLAGARRE